MYLSLIRFVHSFIKDLLSFFQFDIANSRLLTHKFSWIFRNHILFILFEAFASLAYLFIFLDFAFHLAFAVFFRYNNWCIIILGSSSVVLNWSLKVSWIRSRRWVQTVHAHVDFLYQKIVLLILNWVDLFRESLLQFPWHCKLRRVFELLIDHFVFLLCYFIQH